MSMDRLYRTTSHQVEDLLVRSVPVHICTHSPYIIVKIPLSDRCIQMNRLTSHQEKGLLVRSVSVYRCALSPAFGDNDLLVRKVLYTDVHTQGEHSWSGQRLYTDVGTDQTLRSGPPGQVSVYKQMYTFTRHHYEYFLVR